MMQLDFKKRPLGQFLSRHLLFEETDPQGKGWAKGLYLALSVETTSMFASTIDRPAGFIRLIPTKDGQELPCALSGSPAMAVADCGEAGRLRFALDGSALLISGAGLGLTMHVRLGSGESVGETARGFELQMGTTRYIIQPRRGQGKLEVTWNLNALRSSDPVLTFTPDGGELELVILDSDVSYRIPAFAASADEAAAKAEAALQSFCGKLVGKADPLLAYDLWLGFQERRGQNLVVSNRLQDQKANALEQLFAALAFRSAEDRCAVLQSLFQLATPGGLIPAWIKDSAILPEAAPPVYGVALAALDYSGMAPEVLRPFYTAFAAATEWWFTQRGAAGACFYAYPHECGWTGKPAFPAPQPCISPDLLAYLILSCLALSLQAKVLGEDDALWAGRRNALLQTLLQLWDGKTFLCRDALTGETAPAPKPLALVPLLLGQLIPGPIHDALEAEAAALAPCCGSFLQLGLIALGCPALAAKLLAHGAERESTAAAAAFDPARSALLLALQERS